MSADFEKAVDSRAEIDDRPRLIYELSGKITDLRGRADELGMFASQIFFKVPGSDRELRIWGRPIRLTDNETQEVDEYLAITINTVERTEDDRFNIFSEEYHVSDKGITVVPSQEILEKGDLLNNPEQFPVIWQTEAGTWAVFRGGQTYWVPRDPHAHFSQNDLEGEVAMATNVADLLSRLTVGCEEAKYPLS